MKKVISGVKPTGKIHFGNYFGAIQQFIKLQDEFENFIFIADFHSITSQKNPELLREQIMEIAINYIALGLDPEKNTIFKQSDVPEVCELAWILNCITPFSLLERGHAWKDAKNNPEREQNVGLFDYPVLMASDILIYNADLVPVGKDQTQHIEITRDIAKSFNNTYGETFKIPEGYIVENFKTIKGTDGKKMSKSYNNTIEIFSDEKIIKKQIMSIVTDSKKVEESKDPEECNIFQILKLITSTKEIEEISKRYKTGTIGYGEAKNILYEKTLEYFKEAREKYYELKENPSYVLEVLENGKEIAQKIAKEKIKDIRQKIGLS